MNLLPDEQDLSFSGFTKPIAGYRVNPSRVSGAKILICFLVFMALVFIGLCFYFGTDPEQINKPLLFSLCGGIAALWLGMVIWIVRRLSLYGKQRVLLYPEGIVIWKKEVPQAYLWEKLKSVTCKRKMITQGILEEWAYVGKDLEFTLEFENEEPFVINAMLTEIEELGKIITDKSPLSS